MRGFDLIKPARGGKLVFIKNNDFYMAQDREQLVDRILERGVIQEIIPNDKEKLRQRLLNEKLRIYIGADPTSTALHLSHAKNYMLLEEFRKLGHEVIVLFGSFTARIGDPTDQESARKQLSKEEVSENVKDWIRQIKPLMDFDAEDNPPQIKYNDEWLSKLTFEDVVDLASNVTVQQMLERDMFNRRIKEEKPIYLHEFLYPLMQGYDSVAMDVDIELCGMDQTFNALVGRTLLRKYKDKEKFVIAVNLMENPVTGELMSKSKGTGVFLDVTPFDMYGSIMSQPDEMIRVLLINNTRMPIEKVDKIINEENPRDAKMRTAREVTKIFHGEEEANKAQDNFVKLVQNKEAAEDIPQVSLETNRISLMELLKQCLGEDTSNSEIKRLISQNSIKIDGETKNDVGEEIEISEEGNIVKVGKKKWFKIKY
jgi:tyrosyl-tRNA synthetase